jgi:hypothetical protein
MEIWKIRWSLKPCLVEWPRTEARLAECQVGQAMGNTTVELQRCLDILPSVR